jgi:hypothetical protein
MNLVSFTVFLLLLRCGEEWPLLQPVCQPGEAGLGKGDSWAGDGTQAQMLMLMQLSMTYPAKEEIGIETVAVPGSH